MQILNTKQAKKVVLALSLLGAVILLALFLVQVSTLCKYGDICWPIRDAVDTLGILLFVAPPVLLFSLITYRMRDVVARYWLYFTAVWIPLSMLLIYFTPASSSGDWLNIFSKAHVAFYMSALYVIISAILITIVWSETNLTEKQKHM